MLDLTKDYTTEDVASLIASKDDTQNRQLRVTKAGEAYISDIAGSQEIADLTFRLESWAAGNGYTGEEASKNKAWVQRIDKVLRDNWPNPSANYIDIF